MKKNRDGKNARLRPLTLHRETIQILNDPALLELARGQAYQAPGTTMSSPTQIISGGGCC